MKTLLNAFVLAAVITAPALYAQGSGTTGTKTTTTTTRKTTATTGSNHQTTHHVNGVVTARSASSITVRIGAKSRKFSVVKGTKFVGTTAKTGAKVKVSYRSSAPGTAVEVRRRA